MRRTRHNTDSRKFFDWLEIAARDLLAARLLFDGEQCLDIVAFHCQQGIEKALKAYVIFCTGVPVEGHNLTWLCRQAMKQNRKFGRWLDATPKMNRFYIETRYPSDIEFNFTSDTVGEVLSVAQEIYAFVCEEVYGDAMTAEME